MVVTTRHKWDVLTSHSWMDLFTRHNGRCYWPLPIRKNKEIEFSKLEFSKIDVSTVDFSKIDFSKIDFFKIDFF